MHLIRRLFSFRISNPTLSGLYYSFFWMMVGALILSFLLWSSGMKEQSLSRYIYVVHAVAAAFGGLVSGKRSGRRGWYQGGLTGILYGLMIIMIGFLALDSSLRLGDLLLIAAVIASGAIGGMFGVNLKNKS
ncbi:MULTISPECIES: TIGR04086 family membrane protein [Paenibacillus]|jgi:putative membrane protein (TIGR04086 family)|uniref:TIGR04086 family membrane protein n=1 Tax=Paenibacillus TaxID=44249 RepID=UPI000CF966EA|nr:MULTISPECIES: TIGR04086 family membrane protein [Paenibacillus]MBJ9987919.1 TIGR04086 family membrane protein [Paenibacillus sp. S28]MEC0178175.1 TIGR04086 family membrane protein [Paenibacillus favisporus]PQP91508.1 TIGR04086 family membrane protein [Paenibacillus sp. AR247]